MGLLLHMQNLKESFGTFCMSIVTRLRFGRTVRGSKPIFFIFFIFRNVPTGSRAQPPPAPHSIGMGGSSTLRKMTRV